MVRKSAVVFTCGYGASGTGSPDRVADGFPTVARLPLDEPFRRDRGADRFVVRDERGLGLVFVLPQWREALEEQVDHHRLLATPDLFDAQLAGQCLEDGAARALHHESTSRVDSSTSASGYASLSSRQNAQAGQSTAAT